MTVLKVTDLSVSTRLNGKPVEVLRGLDFEIAPGRIVGLVGESGAGKSMIGRVIARNLPGGFQISGGAVAFDGRDLATLGPPALRNLLGDRIACIPQEPLSALNPLLTIGAQFGEHLTRLGVTRSDQHRRMLDALAEVRLPDPAGLIDKYPFQLSGGMCQRVLIALAFASDPALIIADEPTTALDVSTQAMIVQIIRRLQRDHQTALLFITHDLRLAARVCDEILVLYAGEVVERGPSETIIHAPMHPYTRALKAANPSLDGPLTRLMALPDQMPGLAGFADLAGCRFAPRCPTRNAVCEKAPPPLRQVSPGHAIRCVEACMSIASTRRHEPIQSRPVDPATPPVLEVRGVSKVFAGPRTWWGGGSDGLRAVRDVDLIVRPGEFVGIIGESGSGKSTLARLIMGLDQPTSGQILVDGRDVTAGGAPARIIRLANLQMVFQDPQSALNPRRTVERLVTQVMEARGDVTASERQQRAQSLLAETGLSPDLIDRYPAQLSGGQKQRVNIARALCVTPRLLVADEIVSGLDVSVQAQILNLLLDLRAERDIGLVFVSHDLAVVRYLCSRILVMRRGEVVEAGETGHIFAHPAHPYTRALLAAAPPDDPAQPWPPDDATLAAAGLL